MRNRKGSLRVGLGILISVAAVLVLLWFVDVKEVIQAVRQIDVRYLAPVLILSLISYLSRAAGWQAIMPVQIHLWKVFLYINAGYLLNTIFPFRMGELGRAFLLKSSGLDFWEAMPTIVLERMFDFILAVSLFLGALPFILDLPQGAGYAALVGSVVLIGLCGLYLMVRFQEPVLNWIESREYPVPAWGDWLQERLRSLISGLSVLSNPTQFLRAFLWMAMSWGLAWVYQYLLLRAFTPQAELLWAAFGLGAVALGVSLPSSPGNIGVYEASLVAALMVFGLDRSTAFGYAIVSHVLNLSISTVFGSFALVREGFEFREMLEYGKEKEGKV